MVFLRKTIKWAVRVANLKCSYGGETGGKASGNVQDLNYDQGTKGSMDFTGHLILVSVCSLVARK